MYPSQPPADRDCKAEVIALPMVRNPGIAHIRYPFLNTIWTNSSLKELKNFTFSNL
jgi:hypothetical protein